MAALCPDAILEMLRPICYSRTLSLQGDLCHCVHKESLQTVQAVVMLSTSHVLQNSSQFIVQGVEVWTPQGPNLGTDKGWNVLPHSLLSHLGFVGRSWVLLGDPFLTTEESCVKRFHNSCSTSSSYTWAPVFTPFFRLHEICNTTYSKT